MEKYPMVEMDENILINASFCPTKELVEKVMDLKENEAIFQGESVIAFHTKDTQEEVSFDTYTQIEFEEDLLQVNNTWDIFSKNDVAIQQDFELLTEGRKSQPIPETVQCLNRDQIFVEEGAKLNFAILNAESGPIYIGKNAEVMEGSVVRGPFAMCENSILKLSAKIYGATTLGPYCKVGGEVNNSVLMGYSSKAHDGFLGNSVLGEWCNLGADTNNSNLKNNYAEVKLWNYETGRFSPTGLQFCGLMMGDHSKCGINTMFNTGTVVGVSANIYGSGFPRNFVPSFSWGGAAGFITYRLNKVFEVAEVVMSRRKLKLEDIDKKILEAVFEQTEGYRRK
jgi:UDP-N-acetylglucosamine diphosphorylase/glucosamine-1-phosphate N-acetyltransferase